MMRCFIYSYGIGPGDRPFSISNQKEEMSFQFVKNSIHSIRRKIQRTGYELRLYWRPNTRQLSDNKIAHQMMLLGHECEPFFEMLRNMGQLRLPGAPRSTNDLTPFSQQDRFVRRFAHVAHGDYSFQ